MPGRGLPADLAPRAVSRTRPSRNESHPKMLKAASRVRELSTIHGLRPVPNRQRSSARHITTSMASKAKDSRIQVRRSILDAHRTSTLLDSRVEDALVSRILLDSRVEDTLVSRRRKCMAPLCYNLPALYGDFHLHTTTAQQPATIACMRMLCRTVMP